MTMKSGSVITDCEFLVKAINGVVWEADPKTVRFTFVSDQAEGISGFTAEEWLSENFWVDHLHPDDRDGAIEACALATAEGLNHEFEYRMIRANGTSIWIRDTVFVDTIDGEPMRLRGVMIDISEQKQLEAAVHDSEQLLRLIVSSARDMIFRRRFYPVAKYEFVSPAVEEITGYSQQEFYENPDMLMKIIHPEDQRTGGADSVLVPTPEPATFRLIRKDGAPVWIEVLSVTICDDSGDPVAIEGIARNVTARMREGN